MNKNVNVNYIWISDLFFYVSTLLDQILKKQEW